MKYLMFCFFIILIHKDCKISQIQKTEPDLIFEYLIQTRGFYKKIIIDKKAISIQNQLNIESIKSNYNSKSWDTLIKLVSSINLKDLKSMFSPKENRASDRAAIATLKIIKGDLVYKTPSFDHGNPHKSIKGLVKEILSITQNIEKQ